MGGLPGFVTATYRRRNGLHSVLHVVMDTIRSRLKTKLYPNLLGCSLAIVMGYASFAWGSPPQLASYQPEWADAEVPQPVAAESLYPIAEDAFHHPVIECVEPVKRNALVRWWNNRFKPRMQFSHWGYPEYFEEMPLGTAVESHKLVQISKSWAARSVLYRYDFRDDDVMLNAQGERRLRQLTTAYACWMQYPLIVEATPERPHLANARRDHITELLNAHGVSAQVKVGVPTGFMPTGEEALLMNQNLLQQVRTGGSTLGMGGGAGGGMGAGGPNEGAQQPSP